MRILVCVKQVPRLEQVRFQPGTNRIVRDGVESTTNPLDLAALGHALAIRGTHGGEVIAVTMGPPGAREVLTDALRRGADRAMHLVDMRFAGADTLATARTLAAIVDRERPDIVLLGRSTVDGGTAQVGPQLAELTGLAQVTHVTSIQWAGTRLEVIRETEEQLEHWRVGVPAIVSIEAGPDPGMHPRRRQPPTGTLDPLREPGRIDELDADAIGGDSSRYGIRGSATYVQKVIDVAPARAREAVVDVLMLANRIESLATSATLPAGDKVGAAPFGNPRELWVVADRHGDALHPVSAEAIAAADGVAGPLAASVVALVLCRDPRGWPAELIAAGADRVLVARHDLLAGYQPEAHTSALAALVAQRSPLAVIGPWTARGRDYLPRVAARLSLGMTGDVIGLDVDPNPGDPSVLDVVWLKPAWAGTVVARVVARTVPSMGTLRPGCVRPFAPRACRGAWGDGADVETVTADVGGALPLDPRPGTAVGTAASGLLDACPVVLLLGSRLTETDIATAVRLAATRGWSVGGTAAIIASGRLAPALEVSLRKRSLSPRLVVGLGLNGTADLDAVRGARTVITVDSAPDAAAHDVADIAGIVGCSDLLAAMARWTFASPSRTAASGIERA